ncbi:MAG: hypothetical protein EPO12_13450 [Aquabacterium sp.]|nr:MAG: hypothetical protein EPO12_13450 [Aquabacterium sp.]
MTQETGAIEAQSADVAVATASTCNAQGAPFLRAREGLEPGKALGVIAASSCAEAHTASAAPAQRLARLQRVSSGRVNRP